MALGPQKALGVALCAVLAAAQQLPLEPAHDSGQSVTGAFEGWFANPDGTFNILVGYYNRNQKQALDIPIGSDNRIEPGGPDYGQPTHFLSGRQWGIFTIRVPKDFGDKKLTWTLTANGKTTTIPLNISTLWEVQPFAEASGNTPPYIGLSEAGPFINGPKGQTTSLTAKSGEPLSLTAWVADDAKAPLAGARPRTPAVTVGWSKLRGPGDVEFASEHPAVEPVQFQAPPATTFTGRAATTATFRSPGDYLLRIVANDWSGEGGRGFQCCWTNAYVKVSVR